MLIVANWKSYVESVAKAKKLFAAAKRLSSLKTVQLVLAPSLPHLGLLAVGNRSKVSFAAQDVSATTGGAATGEVSAQQLRDAGAAYVIVGHSERRAAGETNDTVFAKVQHALAHGLTPILCIGETERDEDAQYLTRLREQLAAIYERLSPKERLQIVVAYEPVWAIGKTSGDAIDPHDLAEMVLYIRKALGTYLPGRSPQATPILYGGSVEASNARALAGGSGIDGFLVGHASTDVPSFSALVKAVS